MSDYDDLKKYKFDEEPDGNPTTYHQKPKYATAIILGFLVSVLSIIVLSVISISLEKEFNYSFLITLWLIVKVEGKYIPDHSFWKVVIVGILSLMTILSYHFILSVFGYQYTEDADFKRFVFPVIFAIVGMIMSYYEKD